MIETYVSFDFLVKAQASVIEKCEPYLAFETDSIIHSTSFFSSE